MVALFRSQASDLLSTEPFTRLIGRLSSDSADFAEFWERRDLIAFSPSYQQLQHPMLGTIELQPMKLYAVDQDRTVVAYLTEPGTRTHQRLAEALPSCGR